MKTRNPCHKKGQAEMPILTLFAVTIGIVIVGLFLLKIVDSVLTPFQAGVGNVSATAGAAVGDIKDTFTNFWDFVLIMAFLVELIVLFYSAFMIDTHPVFVVMFILFAAFTFMFMPAVMEVVDEMFDSIIDTDHSYYLTQIPMLNFIRNNYGVLMLGILMVSGIIIYGKYRWLGGSSGGGSIAR